MADLKISQLTSLAGSSLAATDELAVVDTSASETKKITSKDLVQYGYGLVDPNTLDGDIIEPGTTSARGTVQLTNSTSSTSTTTAATPNAVKAAFDLASAAMPKSGGTFTGNISFEGSTDDTFETTFAITDPTADRTITFKNESGTVAYLSDISGSAFLPLAGGTMTGQILGDDSTSASTPGYAFDGDPDTGLLRIGANELGLVTGGTPRLTIDASGNVVVPGNFTVQGTTTTIDTTTLVVKDKNIELGVVTTPTDVTADGGGITLKGSTDKTISWVDATDAWTLSEHVNIANGKEFRIAGTKVLDATSLGSSVLITSANITDGTIVNNDINASAAIAGTKISPDFGSQNIITTGTSTAASFIPTSSTAPTNGVYLSAANRLALSTNSAGRLFINNVGQVGFSDESFSHDYSFYQTTNTTLRIANSTSTTAVNRGALIYLGGSDLSIANQESGFLRLLTGSSERLRITSTGDLNFVGAGTAGSTQAINISGSAAVNAVVIDSTGSVSVDNGIFYVDATNNRVGVGTVSCSATLDVGGSTATSNTGLSNVNFYAGLTPTGGGNTYGGILAGSGAGGNTPFIAASRTGAGGALPLTFFTDATERLRISSAGQIQANSLGTAAAPVWSFAGDTNTGIYSPGADQVAISTGGSGRLFVDASGNVGINTASPNHALHVDNGPIASSRYGSPGAIILRSAAGTQTSPTAINTSTNLSVVVGRGYDGSVYRDIASITMQSDGAVTSTSSPGFIAFNTTPSSSTAAQERLRITSAGLVGVGTSSPSQNLHVNSSGNTVLLVSSSFSGSVETAVQVDTVGDTSRANIYFSKSGTTRGSILYHHNATGASERLQLSPAGSTGLNVLGSGNVGIGTTSPSYLLDVISSASSTIRSASSETSGSNIGQFVAEYAGSGGTNAQLTLRAGASYGLVGTVTNSPLLFAANGSERARIDSSGRLLIGQTGAAQYNTFSPDLSVQISRGDNLNANIQIGSFRSDQYGGGLILSKSRSSTVGTNTIVQNGDTLGSVTFNGADGTNWLDGGSINCRVDAVPGTGSMPTRLDFSTRTAAGSASVVRSSISRDGTTTLSAAASTAPFIAYIGASEVARIDSSGRLLVGTSSISTNNAIVAVQGRSDSSTAGGKLLIAKGPGDPVDGGSLGSLLFSGSNYSDSATIGANRDGGTWTAGSSQPSRLVFSTTANGASSPTERMRITSAGNVGIGTASPGAVLHSAVSSGAVVFRGSHNNTGLDLYANDATGEARITSARLGGSGGKFISFYTDTGTGEFERARIDSSGRLLVGTSAGVSAAFVNSSIQAHGFTGDNSSITLYRFTTSATAAATPRLVMARSGSDSKDFTAVASGNRLGQLNFVGADGTQFVSAASIDCEVDGTPGSNDMPGRLVFSTTADGASSPTERMRITNDGVQAYNQPAPAAVNATATLTVANLKAGIITSTSAAATDMTLPTGTDTQAGFSGTYDNFTFQWSVINTGPSLVRVLAATAHTIIGSGSVATGTSGRFASRRTAANTFVTYRLS